jgi:Rad3-related DNA helicase
MPMLNCPFCGGYLPYVLEEGIVFCGNCERMVESSYTNKMLSSLIQACGRGVRSNKDHCVTYILDGAIVENILKYKHKIPKYFLDRFV